MMQNTQRKTVQIGKIQLEQTAALAPMASVADTAYRMICKQYGASFVVGELASAKGLFHSDRKTSELLSVTEQESPMGVQLFGNSPDIMAWACQKAAAFAPAFIDLNMGCPVPKVVKTGSGSALMKSPRLAAEIAAACVSAVDLPITAKIRAGFDASTLTAVEMARRLEDAGVAAITVHGRTREQMYAPPVDLEVIAAVKQAVSVPVIGNGDVTSPLLAKQMYEQTGCDLVMVGRGSYGRPWIFQEIAHYLRTGELLPEKTLPEKLAIMQDHIALACRLKGEALAIRESRKIVAFYLKGVKGAASFRNACGTLQTFADVCTLSDQILAAN